MTNVNQDSYIIINDFACIKNAFLFGVFDGHGNDGHLVSNSIKQHLPGKVFIILGNIELLGLTYIEKMGNDRKSIALQLANIIANDSKACQEIITEAFIKTDALIKQSNFDTNYSGSTAVVVLLIDGKLICANTGDSRAVLGYIETSKKDSLNSNGKVWRVANLSNDHKPQLKTEYERIISSNGRVFQMVNKEGKFVGPYRVWLKDKNLPGLATSRAFGDKVGNLVGVIPDPEIIERKINEDDKFIIIASDGVWQYISSEEAVDMIIPFWEKIGRAHV